MNRLVAQLKEQQTEAAKLDAAIGLYQTMSGETWG